MIRARLLWSSGLLEQFDDFGMTRHCCRHRGGDTRSGFQADIRTAIKKGLHNFNLSSTRCIHQGGPSIPGPCVDIHPGLRQGMHPLNLAVLCCGYQIRKSFLLSPIEKPRD